MFSFVRLTAAFRSKIATGRTRAPALLPRQGWCKPHQQKEKATLRGAILYGARDVRFDERATPTIIKGVLIHERRFRRDLGA